jgi:hypothetical protein
MGHVSFFAMGQYGISGGFKLNFVSLKKGTWGPLRH